jgi:Na+/proline symporter
MLAGFLTAVIWVLFFKEQFYDLYEMLPGFAAGFAGTILVSKWTKPPEGAAEDFDGVWRTLHNTSSHD